MHFVTTSVALTALLADVVLAVPSYGYGYGNGNGNGNGNGYNTDKLRQQLQTPKSGYYISLGPRPFYLIDNMTDSALKRKLQSCENGPFTITDFVLGHRGGGTLQFPEETVQSTNAGARIDITTAEYLSLCGKQDGFNASARTVQAYQYGTPTWRTELYDTCGKVQTLDSYIDLVNSYPGQRSYTPELKTPPSDVPMPFNGYTQEQFARDMINAFIKKGISSDRVWAQSFNPPDIYQWIREYPNFGKQAVFLDELGDDNITAAVERLTTLKPLGVNIVGSPINYLLAPGGPNNRTIVPSVYAKTALKSGLDIIGWTFERSGPLATVKARGEYYFGSIADIVSYDGQYYEALDVLGRQIGIKGLFSDWAATVTYYANCFGLKGPRASDYKPFKNGTHY